MKSDRGIDRKRFQQHWFTGFEIERERRGSSNCKFFDRSRLTNTLNTFIDI